MRKITFHERDYLRKNSLVMSVDEEQVQFINGIAAVNATVEDEKGRKMIFSGIINEEYQEVFDDEDEYGDFYARRNLMFLSYNQNILRCGENDFIVSVKQGDEYHWRIAHKHIKIKDMKVTFINEDIGEYEKTNNENILIIWNKYHCFGKNLYNIAKGEVIASGYDKILTIDGEPNCFYVKKHINSLTEDSPKDEDLYLNDNLYFQIDQNGHIISEIFSERELGYLDYGDTDIDNYPLCRYQELVEKSKKLKEEVHSLRYQKKIKL